MSEHDDVREFAQSSPPPSSPCQTCQHHPVTVQKTRYFLELRATEGTKQTISGWWRYCKARYQYTLSRYALATHITKCEAELYERGRGRSPE